MIGSAKLGQLELQPSRRIDMETKICSLILLACLWVAPAWAFDDEAFLQAVTSGAVAGAPTPLFSDNFDRGDSATVGGSWDAENDGSAKISILSNALSYSGNAASGAYVSENGSFSNQNSSTLKFKIKFSNVTGVHTTTASNIVAKIFTDSGGIAGWMTLSTDGSGNIASYACALKTNGGFEYGASQTITGLTTDTYLDAYIYHVSSATVGGASCKIGASTASSTAFSFANDTNPNGQFYIGATEQYWAGTTPYTMTIDDVAIYAGDQR